MSKEEELFQASRVGDLEEVKRLLDEGVQPIRSMDYAGIPALTAAARKGHLEVIHVLVAHGGDVNQRDRFGTTPLHAAASTNKAAVVETLCVEGADVHAVDTDGHQPHHLAAYYGHLESFKTLVRNGADHERKDGDNLTCEECALRFMKGKWKDIVKLCQNETRAKL